MLLDDGLSADHAETAVVFTHGFALRVITKHLLGATDDDFRYWRNPKNCYVARFSVDDGVATIDHPLEKVDFKI